MFRLHESEVLLGYYILNMSRTNLQLWVTLGVRRVFNVRLIREHWSVLHPVGWGPHPGQGCVNRIACRLGLCPSPPHQGVTLGI